MSKLFRFLITSCLLLTAYCSLLTAQSSTATLSGTVEDEQKSVIPGAKVTIVNNGTGARRNTTTNDSGSFTFTFLPPSTYTVTVEHTGFGVVQYPDVVLNVGDQRAIQVQLKVGPVGAQIEVRPDETLVTTKSDVSTAIDQQFVKNLPLNGRSFQSLFELTPGVNIVPSNNNDQGQFSVNGQRTNANYVTVDGVSANTGIFSGLNGNLAGQSGSGQQIGLTAQGTTMSLVSVDALQEFRIQTSSYAPEFGRMPGGQITLITKSGTNDYHGTLFEYFRNDALDATDWFVNANRLTKPPLRQNQFGGTIGGPLPFLNFGDGGGPLFQSGKDRTFLFFSYEGLRLLQPRAIASNIVSEARRQSALPQFQPYLNALPRPNGADNGNGTAGYAASWSDSSESDATSLRIDHNITKQLSVFGRFSHSPSFNNVRPNGLSFTQTTNQIDTYFTAGSTWATSTGLANELRINFTRTKAPFRSDPDNFGGATPPPLSIFGPGNNPENGAIFVTMSPSSAGNFQWGVGTDYVQKQFNIVDGLTYTIRDHSLKFGIDFRRINPTLDQGGNGTENLTFNVTDLGLPRIQRYSRTVYDSRPHSAAFDNLSLYLQDTWRASGRLTLTYGVRWEFVPPPHATEGEEAITLNGMDDPLAPNHLSIAPRGTPLWEARYNNFAPRFGASYLLSDKSGQELIVRGGFGIFHDLGLGAAANPYGAYPFVAARLCPSAAEPLVCPNTAPLPFPLSQAVLTPPALGVDRPTAIWAMDRNIELPYVWQWNVAIEKSFGPHQTLSASYVGAEGRRLLKFEFYNANLAEWPAPQFAPISIALNKNIGYSDYRALQVQFQRRLYNNFQSLVSYTFGRSRDTASSDRAAFASELRLPIGLDYGYSDYDVRHNLTGAVTYEVPSIFKSGFLAALTRDWGLDAIFRLRSSLPFNAINNLILSSGEIYNGRPNVIPGVDIWVDDPTAPGGRRLNIDVPSNAQAAAAGCVTPATAANTLGAFCNPPAGQQGNQERNSLRGFWARQLDVSLRRDVRFRESLRLQLRLDAFNVTNTPNFANPGGFVGGGRNQAISRQMLGRSLGGLSALYQIGGPRSLQLSAKVIF